MWAFFRRFSPAKRCGPVRLPGGASGGALVVALALLGPALAQRQAPQTAAQLQIGAPPLTRTGCPRTHPVKGSMNAQGVRIYHALGSRAYIATPPMRCFRSAVDAIRAGYRAPAR